MSQAFSTPGGSLGEAEGARDHAIRHPSRADHWRDHLPRRRLPHEAHGQGPGNHDHPAGGARPGWRLSTEIKTTQTMIYRPIHLGR